MATGNPDAPTRRPVLHMRLTPLEATLIALILLSLGALIVPLALAWPSLPATVPSHFGLSGRPDAYSGKGLLLTLPIIAIVFTVFALALLPFPHVFNYPTRITLENAPQWYRLGRGILLAADLLLVGTFAYLNWHALQVAQGHAARLPEWFTSASIAVAVALPIGAIILIVTLGRRGG